MSNYCDSDIINTPPYSPITSSDFEESDTESTCQEAPKLINECVSNPNNISFSYKIIGDNLDKVVTPRFMRKKKYKRQTMHCFHSYALQDQIDTSLMSDRLEHLCLPSPDVLAESLLPSQDDDNMLNENFKILIARVLVQHMEFFQKSFQDIVCHHIAHKYEKEMAHISKVVSYQLLSQ